MSDTRPEKDKIEPSASSAVGNDHMSKVTEELLNASSRSLSNLPDYEKLLGSLSNLPDYEKLLGSLSNLPDYEKLFGSLTNLPDYENLLGRIDLPDYEKLLEHIPEIPDYAKLLERISFPGDTTLTERVHLSHLSTPAENMVTLSSDQNAKLREEIDVLRKNAAKHAKALRAATSGSEEQKREIDKLRSSVEQLKEKQRLGFLLERVHPDAQQHLRESHEFQDKFLATGECSAFVLAVDIRRSTELMLKARTAEKFADFIRGLCLDLTAIVVNSLGVFDKFTGDGILAFFPDFFSGPDAAYRVLTAADECHAAFERHYRGSRTSFKSVLTNVGLGIGIDYGSVRLVQVAGGLTVVGEPVVYACRLSSGPPKVTLANQPAFEQISAKFGGLCFAEEQNHEIKHEGTMLAYEVRPNGRGYVPARPEWLVDSATLDEPKTNQKPAQ